MCPAELRILLHFHTSAESHPQRETEWFKELVAKWSEDGIVQRYQTHGSICHLTERGTHWVDMILNTPMPVSKWVDPRDK
jgi:hypothetical protein